MIFDRCENWRQYFTGSTWESVFDFLLGLTPDSEEGLTEIQGKDVFGRVMSYETKAYDDANIESHREYVDMQAALVNGEGIAWWPVESLKADTEYNEEKDRWFYVHPPKAPARVDVLPGTFAVLFPNDAHMPQLIVDDQRAVVKKVVVKVKADLVQPLK